MIYSATAFHWIPKNSGYAKIKSLLKPNGVVSLFWNHPFVSNVSDKTNLASMTVYKKYRPNDKTPVEFDSTKCHEQINELKYYGFTNIKSKVYKRIRRLTSEEYISLIKTYFDHNALPVEVREAFEQEMKQTIDDVGGVINIYDTIDLYLGSLNIDAEHPEQMETIGKYYPIYDDSVSIINSENNRKVFINLCVPDLQTEYDRIVNLRIANKLTPIRYLNVFSPYWYFTFMDPDGNPIEITGRYGED